MESQRIAECHPRESEDPDSRFRGNDKIGLKVNLILDPRGEPEANMAADEELARRVREGTAPATLRIYGWNQPAVSLGRRQLLEDLPPSLGSDALPIVRRPTGGGAVLHRPDELTYALALPRFPLPLRERVGVRGLNQLPGLIHQFLRDELVRRGLVPPEDLRIVSADSNGPATLCFSSPVCGDLLYRGKKVCGCALRVWRDGLLIQGTIQGLPVRESDLREILVEFGAEAGSRTPTACAIAS